MKKFGRQVDFFSFLQLLFVSSTENLHPQHSAIMTRRYTVYLLKNKDTDRDKIIIQHLGQSNSFTSFLIIFDKQSSPPSLLKPAPLFLSHLHQKKHHHLSHKSHHQPLARLATHHLGSFLQLGKPLSFANRFAPKDGETFQLILQRQMASTAQMKPRWIWRCFGVRGKPSLGQVWKQQHKRVGLVTVGSPNCWVLRIYVDTTKRPCWKGQLMNMRRSFGHKSLKITSR